MTQDQIEQSFAIGLQHFKARRLAEAEDICRQILLVKPKHVHALDMLGMIALQTGRPDLALQMTRLVFAQCPLSAQANNNLGIALMENGDLDSALRHMAQAVDIQPDIPGAWSNMGIVCMAQARHEKALECFRRAAAQEPGNAARLSDLLYALQYCAGVEPAVNLAEHREWSRRHELPLVSQRRPHGNIPDPERRLRIGYLSADLSDHPVGRFMVPLLAHHDHERYEICCYSDVSRLPDVTGRILQRYADRWRVTRGMSDAQLAEQIQGDQIDILVDLAQHTGSNRLLVFARKPAPLQVAYLGYPGTTGLEAMDYRLTDVFLDAPGQGDENYSERSMRLPHCFWCYRPMELAPAVGPLPAAANGHVTFGSMNRFEKISLPTLHLWRRILQKVPTARLLIHSKIGDHLDAVRHVFTEGGIASRRVEFIERQGMYDYYPQFHRMDIALDSFPHGGATITCDALWMGVPVVTLPGNSAVSRAGKSVLSNVGLTELIAESPEDYFSIAAKLAADLPNLARRRTMLRSQMAASPLMDGARFAADIESAYRTMWGNWCRGKGKDKAEYA